MPYPRIVDEFLASCNYIKNLAEHDDDEKLQSSAESQAKSLKKKLEKAGKVSLKQSTAILAHLKEAPWPKEVRMELVVAITSNEQAGNEADDDDGNTQKWLEIDEMLPKSVALVVQDFEAPMDVRIAALVDFMGEAGCVSPSEKTYQADCSMCRCVDA